MMHPDTEVRFVSPTVGHGVFATAAIPHGTLVWVMDELDQRLSREEVQALPEPLRAVVERYGYVDAAGKYVLCWDHGRLMNHGCRPTSRGVGEGFEVAIRDIEAGEQLTCEYATLNISGSFACACGAPDCRGEVRPHDLEQFWRQWDAEAEAAFVRACEVPQPLLPYVKTSPADMPLLEALKAGKPPAELPSSLEYRSAIVPEVAPADGMLWRLAP